MKSFEKFENNRLSSVQQATLRGGCDDCKNNPEKEVEVDFWGNIWDVYLDAIDPTTRESGDAPIYFPTPPKYNPSK